MAAKGENPRWMIYRGVFSFFLPAVHGGALTYLLAIDYVGTVELKDE
jgi:hypothetical protein